MTAIKRVKGTFFIVPFVYGTVATPLPIKEPVTESQTHTHKWAFYVRGIDGNDLSFCVRRVVVKLHESFAVPIRTLDTPPFELTETGWGEFEMLVKVYFIDPSERPVTFYHRLQLFSTKELQAAAAAAASGNPNAPVNITSKGPVVSEHYDELMFSEPGEELCAALRNNIDKLQIPETGEYSLQAEEEEIRTLDEVLTKIIAETEDQRNAIAAAEETLHKLNAELRQLEGSAVDATSL